MAPVCIPVMLPGIVPGWCVVSYRVEFLTSNISIKFTGQTGSKTR